MTTPAAYRVIRSDDITPDRVTILANPKTPASQMFAIGLDILKQAAQGAWFADESATEAPTPHRKYKRRRRAGNVGPRFWKKPELGITRDMVVEAYKKYGGALTPEEITYITERFGLDGHRATSFPMLASRHGIGKDAIHRALRVAYGKLGLK